VAGESDADFVERMLGEESAPLDHKGLHRASRMIHDLAERRRFAESIVRAYLGPNYARLEAIIERVRERHYASTVGATNDADPTEWWELMRDIADLAGGDGTWDRIVAENISDLGSGAL
jgi:hypothetical protein